MVSTESLLPSSPSSFLGVVVALLCIGLRRGDLNGLESVEAAFSARRRFPAKLTEAILTILAAFFSSSNSSNPRRCLKSE